MKEDIDIQ